MSKGQTLVDSISSLEVALKHVSHRASQCRQHVDPTETGIVTDQMFMSPPHSRVEALVPFVTIFGDGA